jgi:hypothetical protein
MAPFAAPVGVAPVSAIRAIDLIEPAQDDRVNFALHKSLIFNKRPE